jgi:DNA primase
MKRRFSAQELFELRNSIPIDTVIKELLALPSKNSEGFFRFLCPICNEFQTAINPGTNLARCFLCQKNFNPIDLVMLVKKAGFIESVTYLKGVLDNSKMLSAIGRPI